MSEQYTGEFVKPIPDDISGIYCIKAPLGSGKTHAVTKYLEKRYKANPQLRVLYLSPRIAFASNVCNNLSQTMPFVSYLNVETYDIEDEYPLLVLQMESLNRIMRAPTYDIIVLDEVKANLKQFFSSTMQYRESKAGIFADLISTTELVFCMDGYLEEDELNLLSKLRAPPKDIFFSELMGYLEEDELNLLSKLRAAPKDIFFSELITPPKKRQCYELNTKKEFIACLLDDLNRGKNIYFCSSSKNFLDRVAEELSKEGTRFRIYHQGTDDKIKRKDFANVESTWNQYQFIGTSPTTTVGVDFSVEHFHAAYLYVGRHSCVVRDMFQMLHRVRKLTDNRVMLFSQSSKDPNHEPPPLLTKEQIFKSLRAKTLRAKFGQDIELEFCTMPQWLQEYYIPSLMEEDRTKKDLNGEIRTYLALGNYELHSFRQEEEIDLEMINNRPHFDDIKTIDLSQARKLEKRRNRLELSEDEKWRLAKYNFLKRVKTDSPELAWLWQKNNPRDKIKIAYYEKNKSREDLQKIDLYKGFAELSLEYRVKYDIMRTLNDWLGMEHSFAQGNRLLSNEELVDLWNRFEPRFKDNVRGAFKINVHILEGIKQEPHKQIVTILNDIYSKWTGKQKLYVGPRKRQRINGKITDLPRGWMPHETIFKNDEEREVRFWDLIAEEEEFNNDDIEYTRVDDKTESAYCVMNPSYY